MDTQESPAQNSSVNCGSTMSQKGVPLRSQHPQNENVLTVNVQAEHSNSSCVAGTAGQVAVSPQPLRLDINTSTDWPTVLVGCAGILSSIVIARYTSRVQTNQIKSSIANLRQRWIEDLRDCASNFMEKMTFIYNKMEDHEDYLSLPESTEPFSAMLSAQIKFALMLDVQHERNRRAIDLSERIIFTIKSHSKSDRSADVGNLGNDFEDLVRKILEAAWQDIKRDLLGRRWYDFLLRARINTDA